MSVKKWNTIFAIVVPVGVVLIFILTRVVTGPHTRLVAWIGLFVWLIGSQVWQSRVTVSRYQAQTKLWTLAAERGLTAADLHEFAPQYSEQDLDESRPEHHRFLISKKALQTLLARVQEAPAPAPKKRHRK
ncbi:hypothetical protein ACFQ3L_07265 [Lacticaseibacillus jixianensis]|uniref:Uncharacterized protein n=1 Tax=Lacticaseibacillus jixianensis TaxID=2486012 RepID=A0ABW4BAR8_9LACO|nr:hypothetical protein [Lacticaseibacillus jixianensis]